MSQNAATLRTLMTAEVDRPVAAPIAACATFLSKHYGVTTAAILFYGAGLRAGDAQGLLDFYVIVDSPRRALHSRTASIAATLLPPNVYRVDVPWAGSVLRAKVAVIGRRAFIAGMTAFSAQLWARFAQPATVVYARDIDARDDMIAALATAAHQLIACTLPLMPVRFTAVDLWRRGLQECYATELRPERATRAETLTVENTGRLEAVTMAILGPSADDKMYVRNERESRARARVLWWLRRRWGKTTNLLRLMKAAFTFAGGLDYAVAKIARHTGVEVKISDRDRRHPLLAGIRVFLEARRRDGVR